jgi:hypothetical protein
LEAGLNEVTIRGQRPLHPTIGHHHERHAIDQTPSLVPIPAVLFESAIEEIRSETNNLRLLGMEKALDDLDGILATPASQSIADLKQDRIRDKQRPTTMFVGQANGPTVVLVA